MGKNSAYFKMFAMVIAAIVIGGGVLLTAAGFIKLPSFQQSAFQGADSETTCADLGGTWSNGACIVSGDCATAPSVATTINDALSQSTTLSATANYRYADKTGTYVSTTTAPTFKTITDVLFVNASYLNVIKSNVALDCGANPVAVQMYAVANATLSVYNDAQTSVLTNAAAGGAVNETAKSAGSSYNWKIHMQGVDKKSTGRMLVVVETSEKANVSSMSLGGATAFTGSTNGYSNQLTNGYIKAWTIDSITGTSSVDKMLTVTAQSGKVVSGAVYITIYSLEPFVETDGTFNAGTSAWDADNTAKSATSQTYNFLIK